MSVITKNYLRGTRFIFIRILLNPKIHYYARSITELKTRILGYSDLVYTLTSCFFTAGLRSTYYNAVVFVFVFQLDSSLQFSG
jgi:hypothetical protein